MKDKDNSMEGQAVTLADELLRAMLGDIEKNTEAVKGNNAQMGQMGARIGELAGVKERMESLEKELVSAKEVLAAVKEIVDRAGVPEEKIDGLRTALFSHAALFEKPWRKEIYHRHFIGWPIVVIFVFFGMAGFSMTLMGVATVRAERYKDNDIKWRYAKLIKDSVLLRKLDSAETKYQENPDEFRGYVTGEEQRREKLAEKLLEKEASQEEIDEIRKKEKHF